MDPGAHREGRRRFQPMAVLRVESLWVDKILPGGSRPALRGINLDLPEDQVTVLLGETGAGKTLLARALAGLLPDGFRQTSGTIIYRGQEMNSPDSWARVRGHEIFYAPQNAAACLNPVLTIGRQIRECSRIGAAEIEELLVRLRFSDPGRILRSYPHALSGGENQRSLLALALAARPDLLILDEPTSELDADCRDEFARALLHARQNQPLTILLVTHNLDFSRGTAARLCIMADGAIVAAGCPDEVLSSDGHPYARQIAPYLTIE